MVLYSKIEYYIPEDRTLNSHRWGTPNPTILVLVQISQSAKFDESLIFTWSFKVVISIAERPIQNENNRKCELVGYEQKLSCFI
jgi:hypothetical protein